MAANSRVRPTGSGRSSVVRSGGDLNGAVEAVVLTDGAGNIIATTDNGDGTATLGVSGGGSAGSATAAKQDVGNTSLASIDSHTPALGQAAMAASSPVVIASDQSAVATSAGAATRPAATTMQSAAVASGNGTSLPVTGMAVALLNVVSSPSMSGGTTLNFEASVDDTTWVAIAAHTIGTNGSLATTATADGDFRVAVAGYKSVRCRISAYSAGTVTVKGYAVPTASQPTAVALATGTNSVGQVTANAGTNLNTSALALDASLTGGTQQARLTDGTNIGHILKADGTSAGQNAQLVAGGHLAVSFTTTTAQAVSATDAANYAWVSVQITSQGTSSTVTFQCSNDNTNWVSAELLVSNSANTTTQASATATNIYHGPLVARYFRLNVTGISAGTTAGAVEFFATPKSLATMGVSAAQSGTWTVQPGNTANTTAWKVDGSAVTQPVSQSAAATGGYSYTNITTNTTTTAKSGAGTCHTLVINSRGTGSTATVYDNTAGSGTKIATIDTTLSTTAFLYDVAFTTGLTIVTAGAGTADLTVTWK